MGFFAFFALCALLLCSFILPCAWAGRVNSAVQDKPALPKLNKLRLELRARQFSSSDNSAETVAAEEGGDGRIRLDPRLQAALKRSQVRKDRLNRMTEWQHSEDELSGFASTISSTYDSNTYASLGAYLVDFQLGTPSQSVKLVLDTGSDLVWVASGQGAFVASESSSYKQIGCSESPCSSLQSSQCQSDGSCGYSYGYADGSATAGVLSQESLVLSLQGGQTSSIYNFNFGYSASVDGDFVGGSGVLGLSFGELSFASQIGNEFGNIFSYCLVAWDAPDSETSPLVFGDGASSSASSYTPLITNSILPRFYYVGLDSISVGGQVLDIPTGTFDIRSSGTGGVFMDSGTTITYLAQPAYDPLVAAMQAAISYPTAQVQGLDVCYDVSEVSNLSFPSLSFSFSSGFQLSPPRENYFFKVSESSPVLCLAIGESSAINIFGNILQQGYQITYDRQNARLGFNGPVDCKSIY